MIRALLNNSLTFLALVFLQVFVFNSIQFSGLINPYYYAIFILLLPFETPGWLLLIIAFFLGLSVDIFSNTLGIHAVATVFMAFVRPSVLKNFAPRDGYEPGTLPRIHFFGLSWFVKYTLILIFVHHFALFYTEVFRLSDFFLTFSRVICSTLFTSTLIVISQYFIFRR